MMTTGPTFGAGQSKSISNTETTNISKTSNFQPINAWRWSIVKVSGAGVGFDDLFFHDLEKTDPTSSVV